MSKPPILLQSGESYKNKIKKGDAGVVIVVLGVSLYFLKFYFSVTAGT